MSQEPILEIALRVLSCYVAGWEESRPDPVDIASLRRAAGIAWMEEEPDALAAHLIQRELQYTA